MTTVLERYRVIKGGTEYRFRRGDVWEVIQHDFERDLGFTHLSRKCTHYLNGRLMARKLVHSGHFERMELDPDHDDSDETTYQETI